MEVTKISNEIKNKIKIWYYLPVKYKKKYYQIKFTAGSIILKQIHNIIIIKELYILSDFREKGIIKSVINFLETDNIFRENKIKIQSILNKKLWEFFRRRRNWNPILGEYSMILNRNGCINSVSF